MGYSDCSIIVYYQCQPRLVVVVIASLSVAVENEAILALKDDSFADQRATRDASLALQLMEANAAEFEAKAALIEDILCA